MFASGIPCFSVSIALGVGLAVVLGVLHDPVHRETFWATAGGGSWLDGRDGLARPGACGSVASPTPRMRS